MGRNAPTVQVLWFLYNCMTWLGNKNKHYWHLLHSRCLNCRYERNQNLTCLRRNNGILDALFNRQFTSWRTQAGFAYFRAFERIEEDETCVSSSSTNLSHALSLRHNGTTLKQISMCDLPGYIEHACHARCTLIGHVTLWNRILVSHANTCLASYCCPATSGVDSISSGWYA
jgi:hypothetical protein